MVKLPPFEIIHLSNSDEDFTQVEMEDSGEANDILLTKIKTKEPDGNEMFG